MTATTQTRRTLSRAGVAWWRAIDAQHAATGTASR